MTKMCSICRTPKEEAEFRLMKKRNRRNSYCRECERWYMRNYMRAYRDIKLNAVLSQRECRAICGCQSGALIGLYAKAGSQYRQLKLDVKWRYTMKEVIKEYIKESVAYLNVGIWIGVGVALGMLAALTIL